MSKIINSKLSKVKIAAMMLIILLSAITFAIQSQPVKHVTPDIVMRRESFELDPAFEEALNVSLKRGYCQAVNWKWAEVSNG